eukprot:872563-Pelagomonas_calceolata.AAC.3
MGHAAMAACTAPSTATRSAAEVHACRRSIGYLEQEREGMDHKEGVYKMQAAAIRGRANKITAQSEEQSKPHRIDEQGSGDSLQRCLGPRLPFATFIALAVH